MNRPDNASIQTALGAIPDDAEFDAAAVGLLAALGYRSDRTPAGQTGAVEDFLSDYPALSPGTAGEGALRDAAGSVRLLFQFTEGEIPPAGTGRLFAADDADGGGGFGGGNARSFLFAAVDLRADGYPRGRYAALTREINRHFSIPVVTLFRTAANRVTLGFLHRRANQVQADRDVLGRVSLVREIDPAHPHRAHLDLLAELSLPERLGWMDAHGQPRSFDGLLAAWLAALDTEALNRRFYADLFQWFQRAAETAQFPAAGPRALPPEEHLIRLITRLLFAWFIKEKGLVAEELFNESRIAGLLKDYDRAGGDSYYRAVLQNLFFATLNTEIGQRRFSKRNPEDHRDFSVYRYEDEIANRDALQELFAKTPFINGGLFDCLDSFDGVGAGGVRIDCFTDNPQQRRGYSLPNRLFFGPRPDPASGQIAENQAGIIDLFHRYKFTVQENTPAEEEVALDPELLGKVFENLLAYYVPETRDTARKLTGSYYTPRPVVDYMVDEALLGALARRTAGAADALPDGPDAEWADSLRRLLDYAAPDYSDAPNGAAPNAAADAAPNTAGNFSEAQRESLVRAIAGLKILDPAVGSGAFPMGVLHKLTLALRRLDPDNRLWETVQREQAVARSAGAYEKAGDQAARNAELEEISEIFETYRDSDFGRKLYLIQHSIYGVDIQPIAAQIAKLRFFISLAIEQQPGGDPAANYGIQPLPNLETRFVAADALLALERPRQLSLGQTGAVRRLERELAANRERHFHAAHRQAKRECRDEDERLRGLLAAELETAGFPAASAGKIAQWNPYDQNGQADWFDPEYMFGVAEGFDVVIANPPYVRQEEITPPDYKAALLRAYSDAAVGRSDLYCYFYARALQLLAPGGMQVFVCSNSWLDVGYGAKLQEHLLNHAVVEAIYESAVERQFSTAAINTIISVARRGNPEPGHEIKFVRLLEEFEKALKPGGSKRIIAKSVADLRAAGTDPDQRREPGRNGQGGRSGYVGDKWGGKYLRAPDIYHHILEKYGDKLVRLGDIATVRFGIKTGANEFFYLKPERIAEFGIEDEFLAPVMTSPTESRSLIVDPATLPYQIFMCHQERKDLQGTGALAYIEWAERNHNWHTRPSTRNRRQWYDLGERQPPPITMNRIIDQRANAYTMPPGTYADATLQEVHGDPAIMPGLAESLNSDFAQVQYNIEGRANFGGGALELKIYETEKVLVEKPNIISGGGGIRFTESERQALEAALRELVNHRRLRAQSV